MVWKIQWVADLFCAVLIDTMLTENAVLLTLITDWKTLRVNTPKCCCQCWSMGSKLLMSGSLSIFNVGFHWKMREPFPVMKKSREFLKISRELGKIRSENNFMICLFWALGKSQEKCKKYWKSRNSLRGKKWKLCQCCEQTYVDKMTKSKLGAKGRFSQTRWNWQYCHQSQVTSSGLWSKKPWIVSSGSTIWSRGGPRIFFRDFANVAKRSPASKANNIIFQYQRIWEFWQICSFLF